MKLFIAILLCYSFSAPAGACVNKIAKSEVADAIALKPGVGAKACNDEDPCICFDGVDWEAAVWDGETLSTDPDKKTAKAERIAREETARKTKRQELKVNLRKCLKANPTNTELRECVAALVKDYLADVDVDEPSAVRSAKRKAAPAKKKGG